MTMRAKIQQKTRNLILPILLGSLTLVGISGYLIFRYISKTTPIDINVITNTGSVALAFSPPTTTLIKGIESTLPITINTGGSKVTAATIAITFNSAKLQVISVSPANEAGNFLTNTIVAPIISGNNITFVYAAPPSSGGIAGTGTLATIHFKPLADNTTALMSFAASTEVAAIGSDTNILRVADPITLNIPAAQVSIKNSADITDDGNTAGDTVNGSDYNLLLSKWNQTGTPGWITADIIKDGKIDGQDYNKLVSEWLK